MKIKNRGLITSTTEKKVKRSMDGKTQLKLMFHWVVLINDFYQSKQPSRTLKGSGSHDQNAFSKALVLSTYLGFCRRARGSKETKNAFVCQALISFSSSPCLGLKLLVSARACVFFSSGVKNLA